MPEGKGLIRHSGRREAAIRNPETLWNPCCWIPGSRPSARPGMTFSCYIGYRNTLLSACILPPAAGASHGRPRPADVERESRVLARPFFWWNGRFRRVHGMGGNLRHWRPLGRPAAGIDAATDDGASGATAACEEVAAAQIAFGPAFQGEAEHGLRSRRELRLRDELLVGIGLKTFEAAFVTVTGILDAAERRFRRRDHH
jgi:hypothetical protein